MEGIDGSKIRTRKLPEAGSIPAISIDGISSTSRAPILKLGDISASLIGRQVRGDRLAIAFLVVGSLCILWLVYKVHIMQEEYKRNARAMDQFQAWLQKRGKK